MSVTFPDLEAHLKAIGNAIVLAGDPTVAGGMSVLGLKEGDISVEWNEEFSDLTAPEQAGPTIFQRKVMGQNPVVTIPMIIGDPELYATLSPTGSAAGGFKLPQDVVTTTLALVPESEFGSSFEYDGTAWTPGNPEHAVWFWRGHFTRPGVSFRSAEGGKRVEQTTFQVMWAMSDDPALTLADGQKLFLIGDPVAAGVTDLLI